EGDKHTLSK
nr:10 kda calcium-binding protein peptide T-11 [rabbits, lung, Peptide Partial, 9 aa] [Oryctolagus cuniculus]